MTDPNTSSRKRKPARAEPLQPDLPGQGDRREPPEPAADEKRRAEERRTQSETALRNVRDGYK